MSFLEFFILAVYLSLLASIIVAVQLFNPGKTLREHTEESQKVQIVEEPFLDSELEEPTSEGEKPPFHPEVEEYTMTENPMLRHRNVMEEVD